MISDRVRTFSILCIAVSSLFFVASRQVQAFIADYTPLSQIDLASKFKLKEVPSCQAALKEGKTVEVAGCQLNLKGEADLEILGKDRANKPFRIILGFSGLGTSVYTGDMDKNGLQDILIAGVTGGCGLAPPMNLDAVLFDKNGRPSLWGVDSYSGEEPKQGNTDLIRLGSDPRAVIIQENVVYRSVGERNLSYWRTLLYRAENGGWRLLPEYRGHAMPLVVRFRFKSNHSLVKTIPWDIREFANASTVGPNAAGLKEVVIKDIKYDDEGRVESIDFGSGPVPFTSSDRYYGTTVYCDTDELFSAASLGTGLSTELLKEASNNKSRIKVPAASWSGCLPWEMWIVQSRRPSKN